MLWFVAGVVVGWLVAKNGPALKAKLSEWWSR